MRRMNGKKLGMAALSAAALVLAGAGAVAAETEAAQPGKGQWKQQFDANGDGKLDDTEREAMKAQWKEHKQALLQKFDANGDGQLDDAERQKLHEERAASRFKQLDTNGDGALSQAEFQAGAGGHHGGGGGHRHGRR